MIYTREMVENGFFLEHEQFIKDIQTDSLNIIFESVVINEEYRLDNIKNNQMFLYIRTKKKSGAMHDCTVKLINGNKYSHGSDLGLEIKVEKTSPHYYVWVGDGKSSRGLASKLEDQLTNPEKKFLKKVINENYEDILIYWELDLDDPKDMLKAQEIESRIYNKYRG